VSHDQFSRKNRKRIIRHRPCSRDFAARLTGGCGMRNLSRLLLVLGILLLSSIIQAQDVPTITVRTDNPSDTRLSAVNVRSAPYGYIYGVLYDGDMLTVTGRSGFDTSRNCTGGYWANYDMWLRVDYHGFEGWIAYCLGIFEGDLNNVPIVTPISPVNCSSQRPEYSRPRDELGSPPDEPYIVVRNRYALTNLRAEPNPNASCIDASSSHEMYVVGRTSEGIWIEVVYTGYPVFADYRENNPPQVLRGWMLRSAVHVIAGYDENSIPIVE
jgi:hypothetical protein